MTAFDPINYDFLTPQGAKEIKASSAVQCALLSQTRHALLDLAEKVVKEDPAKAETIVVHLRLKETLALLTMSQAQIHRENEELEDQIKAANAQLGELSAHKRNLKSTLEAIA